MLFQEALGEVIREERLAQGKTLRDLSSLGFVALGYLSEIERGQKSASSEIIEMLANGLGKPTYELIIEAGYRMSADTVQKTVDTFHERSQEWLIKYSDLVR
jgi:transcriptional regulator with XRE-family HTH domain